MKTKRAFRCYAIPTQDGRFEGKCYEYPTVSYKANSRDAATAGARRQVKRHQLAGIKPWQNVSQSPVQFVPSASTVTPTPPAARQKVNYIVIALDRSGSMASLLNQAVAALNNNIRTIRDQSQNTGQKTYLSVIAFDNKVETILRFADIETVREFYSYEPYFSPRGSTALFDATGEAIEEIYTKAIPDDVDASFLVLTITDGGENASLKYLASSLSSRIRDLQLTDRWTFSFLVPPRTGTGLSRTLGVPAGNIMEWEQSTRGVQQYAAATNAGMTQYFASRSVGVNSTKSFYTDLSGLTSKDLRKNLVDLSGQFRSAIVNKEQDVKSFVEDTFGGYVPGCAYYQLTKNEKKVQAYKKLLVMEKGKKEIYGGNDARSVLGIPDGDLKITPGNHGNFDIFVQSTSLNRKLVRGTKVLVDASAFNSVMSHAGRLATQAQPRARRSRSKK